MSYLKKLVLPIPLFFAMSYGLPIPKGIPIPKELKDTMEILTTEQRGQHEKHVNAMRQSCESMAYNSPKASLAEKAGKEILKGAAVGAIIGATVSEDMAEGAVLGGIAGALAATAYKMATTSHLQRESYESTAKRLGYPLYFLWQYKDTHRHRRILCGVGHHTFSLPISNLFRN